jgi:hypothetical protein
LVEEVRPDTPLAVRWVHEPNAGLGFARNAAIASATGRVIAFLDDDALADPNWTAELLEVFKTSDAAVVGGRVDPLWEGDRPAWLNDEFLTFLSILDYGPTRARCTFPKYPFGVNIAFQRAMLVQVGGFATALGGGGKPTYTMDEIDVCRRIEAAGGDIIYAPAARVRHRVPAQRLRRSFILRRAADVARSTVRMSWQNAPRPSVASSAKGEAQAAVRAVRHAARALTRLTHAGGGDFVAESRHVVWNLAWMWETAILTSRPNRIGVEEQILTAGR